MLTSKQRAELRAKANGLEVTLMIGKEGISGGTAETASGQLENRELIKGRFLETAGLTGSGVFTQKLEELENCGFIRSYQE